MEQIPFGQYLRVYGVMAKGNRRDDRFQDSAAPVIAGKNIVEVVLDGNVVATIAANGIDGIQVMSAHLNGHWLDDGEKIGLGTPSIHITFKARPVRTGGQSVRDSMQ